MKEATGELSGTVITIAAIALIAAVFAALLLPNLRTQIVLSQACTNGPDYTVNNDDGSSITCNNSTKPIGQREWTCLYKPKKGNTQTKTCRD